MRPLLPVLGAALVLALLAAPTVAAPTSTPPAPPTDARSAPEGGPVDHGWLPGPSGTTFAQFAGEPPPGGGPVWPGVRRDARQTLLADGKPVDVQILHLDPGADVEIRPSLARGSVRGLATVAAQSGDPLAGAVAAVNGGFWLREPMGEPNGLFAIDGRLISDAETQGAGPRGTVGWTGDGGLVIDRIDSRESVVLADGTTLTTDGLNRGHREHDELFADGVDSLLAYTSDYGGLAVMRQPERPEPPADDTDPPLIPGDPAASSDPQSEAPVRLAAVRIAVPMWPATGIVSGVVSGLTRDQDAAFGIDPGEVLLIATGTRAEALDGVAVGDVVVLGTTLLALDASRDAEWARVTRALAGGPMIVKGGQVTDPGDWVNEGFEPHVHSDVRAPRTAIGVTADGRTLMVVADGRRPGVTHGFTIGELGQYMVSLGAVEALSLDGGGSSQIVVDGIMRNVPCCDSSTRAVADSLQVVHRYRFTATARISGTDRVDTAAAVALQAYPQGSAAAVLATASAFPDALAGGPLAAAVDGPLLLTNRSSLPARTLSTLQELGTREVWLLGGEAVIGQEVEAALVAAGILVHRIAGGSRYDTAAMVAGEVQGRAGRSGRVFLTPAGTFPDALLAAGPGGILSMPVLLTDPSSLHPATRQSLSGISEVVVIDSDGVLAASLLEQVRALGTVVTVLGGGGRYATAAAVNRWLATQADLSPSVVVTRGDDFPDALAGGPLAARQRSPLMLVPPFLLSQDPAGEAWLEEQAASSSLDSGTVLGGMAAVTSYQQWQLDQLAMRSRTEPATSG